MLTVTPSASTKIKEIIERQPPRDGLGLRLALVGGGCSGFEYDMGFDVPRDSDEVLKTDNGVAVIVDPMSLRYLKGIKVDFVETLKGAGFTFDNPNAKRSCGCGKSFSA